MRKLLFCAIVMAMSVMSNAQTLHKVLTTDGGLSSDLGFVPPFLTYDGRVGIINVIDEKVANVYNEDFEFVRSFTIATTPGAQEEYIHSLDIVDYDNVGIASTKAYLTQTLFNNDEKYEYVINKTVYNGNTSYDEYRIVSEDGRVLLTISDLGYLEDIYKINNKYYICFRKQIGEYWEQEYAYYRMDPQTTSISLVESMPVSPRSIHSLDGRKQSAMQRGVNIVRDEDGTTRKVLKN